MEKIFLHTIGDQYSYPYLLIDDFDEINDWIEYEDEYLLDDCGNEYKLITNKKNIYAVHKEIYEAWLKSEVQE